jgi:hypothetical protein
MQRVQSYKYTDGSRWLSAIGGDSLRLDTPRLPEGFQKEQFITALSRQQMIQIIRKIFEKQIQVLPYNIMVIIHL